MRNAIFIGLLAAAAAFWNLHAPTVFFDSQIMLGGSLAVFALLQFGWSGLAVGIIALAATAIRWGHPFELLIGTTFLVWLKIFLERFNGGWHNRDNGRVVLAALGFWLVAGIALEVLLFNRVLGIAAAKAFTVGLKEAVTALVNTTLGFLAYLAVRWFQASGAQRNVSARGLVFASILAAITIPGVGLSMTLSGQLKRSVLEGYLADLKHFGAMSAVGAGRGKADRDADSTRQQEDMAFLARRGDGTVTSSDPALFERLARDFEIESPSRTRLPGLDIFKPTAGGPIFVADDNSYWSAKFTVPDPAAENATLDVTVVQTTPRMIRKIDHELLLPSFALLFAIMSIGTLASEALGLAVDRQFRSVIGPLQEHNPDEPMPDLAPSKIRELDTIVAAGNERSRRVNELGDSLRRALDEKNTANEETIRLINGLPMAITTNSIEPNPKLTFLNEQFVRTFGYTKEDIPSVAEWARKAYPDEDYRREVFKKWDTALARALETKGLVESIETRVTCKDGTVRDTLINAVVLEDKLVIGLLDISERKRAEEELRESEARFRLMADAAPVLIWVAGTGQGCTWFNKVWLDFTGRTMEQELGDGWTEGVHPDDRKRCLDIYTDHFRRRAPFAMDYRLRRHDGEYRWLADSGLPRFDGEGNFAGFIGSCVDITDRKLAEDRLRRLVDALPVSVMISTLDFEGDITYVNDQFVRTFGYALEEIARSRDWLRLAYPDEEYRTRVTEKWLAARTHAFKAGGLIEPMEFAVVCKDGTTRDTLFSAIFLEDRILITLVDLTDLKRTERALRSAQAKAEAESLIRERMTLAARASNAAFWDWDLATGVVTWSDEMKSFFGIDPAKTGADFDSWKVWKSMVHPEDLPAAEERAHEAARNATPVALSYRIVLPDGSIRWVDTHGDVIRDREGKAVRIAGISRDVTTRKETEVALQSYRDQLEKLLAERTEELDVARRQLEKAAFEVTENIPVGTYTMAQPPGGGTAHYSFVSRRFLEMTGLDRESATADVLNTVAAVHPDDRDEWVRKNAEALEKKVPFEEEFRIIVNGQTRWVSAESIPRDTPDGSVVWEGVLADITERKLAEQKLAESEENLRRSEAAYRALIENSPVGIFGTDSDGRITLFNPSMLRILGIDTVEADFAQKFYVNTEDRTEFVRRLRQDGKVEHFEVPLRHADGHIVWADYNARIASGDPGGKFTIQGFFTDITERKTAEEKLRLSEEKYRNFFNLPLVGTAITAAKTGWVEVNDQTCRILGYTREELRTRRWSEISHPDDLASDNEQFKRMLRREIDGYTIEKRFIRKDGSTVHTLMTIGAESGGEEGTGRFLVNILDISDRKRLEDELRLSEEKYRNFFNLPLVGTAISSRTKGWVEVNDATCEILGYPREELFQKTWADITHPDDLAADEAQFARMLRREIDGYQLEKRFIRKDGSVVHTLLVGGCGPIGDRLPELFYVNILDISRSKQLEEELVLSEERHRLLADNAADVINVIGLDGRLLYVSPSVEKLIGYTQEEALKLSVEDILVPEAAAGARAGLAQTAAALAAGGPLPEFHGEFPHRHKDGHTVWTEATSTCMLNKEGKYIGTLVVTRDISERKRLETELRISEEHHRLLAENSADVIWLMDLQTMRFTYVSPSVRRLRGFTVQEVLQQTPQEAMTPESYRIIEEMLPRRLAAFEGGDESERTRTHEVVQPRKDGTFVQTEVTTTLLSGPDGRVAQILGISRDITERKAIEAELAAAREREKKTETEMRATLETKLKTSLNAAAVAHEINQPLSRILLRARMDLEKSHDAGSDTLHALIADAERVVNTIEKMKVLLRNVETVQQPVNLAQIITSSLHQLKQPLRQNKVSVKHTGPEESCILMGDEVQLQMAFTNLLRNAIEAIAQSGTDRREISIERIQRDGAVDIVIGDSGPGWPGGTVDDALLATSKPEGSGIGLYIVKTAVENHRGKIAIGRSPLGGAEFRLSFARLPANYPTEGRS